MKPTDLKKMLPELTAGQLKWLERYVTEQRIDELQDLEFIDWESYGDGPRPTYDTGINELIDPLVDSYVRDRIAQLNQEAGL